MDLRRITHLLVVEDIANAVTEGTRDNAPLRVQRIIRQILSRYDDCPLTPAEIADLVSVMAENAGVNVRPN